jgi:fermentation-respiration switch protein FrsA (DUF1100 family)
LLGATGCLSRSFLYTRTHLDRDAYQVLANAPGWGPATLSVGETDLAGLVRRPSASDAPWILYFGGNATSLAGSQQVLERLGGDEDAGLAVFAYRGYDGSEGTPTQKRLIADGLAAVSELETLGARRERLVIVGQSLGTGVAAQVTATLVGSGRPPAALVLVSPFTSVLDVVRAHTVCMPSCLVADKWATSRRTKELALPVLVLHGTKDTIIPLEQGEAIAASIPGAAFVPVGGRDHNDVWSSEARDAARAFVRDHTR